MKDVALERATNVVAGGAATSWAWLPHLQDGLSIVLTVLGIAWLMMQMYYKWRSNR